MNFKNPWADAPNFIFLGTWNISERQQDGGYKVICRDLYALEHLEAGYVDLGCRYSDDEADYASGFASRNVDAARKNWVIYGGNGIHAAAARYFANHHPEIKS